MGDPCILHCDMNSYFASVELLTHPEWRGKPMAVAGSVQDRCGVILAKTEEAKRKGIKTGESVPQALGKCPELILAQPHYDKYLYYSHQAKQIYLKYTEQVEAFGLDECWLDVSGSQGLFGPGRVLADKLRQEVKRELGLSISVGVSFNKCFAKLASDLKKPDAVTELSRENFQAKAWPLEVQALLGVGPATGRKLQMWGIYSIGQLAQSEPEFLRQRLGICGFRLWQRANGQDESVVLRQDELPQVQSIGHSSTQKQDIWRKEDIDRLFLALTQDVSQRLYLHKLKANALAISVKDNRFNYQEFQVPLPYPAQSSLYLAQQARALFRKNYQWRYPVRALGVRALKLQDASLPLQLNLFADFAAVEKLERLEQCRQELNLRFGPQTLNWAGLQIKH